MAAELIERVRRQFEVLHGRTPTMFAVAPGRDSMPAWLRPFRSGADSAARASPWCVRTGLKPSNNEWRWIRRPLRPPARRLRHLGDNVVNALNLLRAMEANGVKRIILSSTADLFAGPLKMPIDEDERIIPGSPYGEPKGIIERFLHWLSITRGLRYACLRYFNAARAAVAPEQAA